MFFSFGEKLGFTLFRKKIVNLSFKSMPRNTMKRNLLKLYASYVLNLCVQDGIRALDTFLESIRNIISYIWVHPRVTKAW